jgi:hypothetical protein
MIRNILKKLLSPLQGSAHNTSNPTPSLNPIQSDKLNVFAGVFKSEMDATDYALGLVEDTSLSDHLGGAIIAPYDVEVIYGIDRISAARPMLNFVGPQRIASEANTYLLLTDRGFPTDELNDDRVSFLGQCTVS